MHDIIIIGAGVIGCALARHLSTFKLDVAVLEKEFDVAEGISKANSGVIHAGFNVKPGSLKAKFNLEGLHYFPHLCNQLDVPFFNCKKLVVARKPEEIPHLEKLMVQGRKNGCSGLSLINKEEINKIEPEVNGVKAIYSQITSFVPPYEFTIALAENSRINGVEYHFGQEVESVAAKESHWQIFCSGGNTYKSKLLINAAGMASDKILNLITPSPVKIYPVRGEYLILDKNNNKLLSTAIYPVPPPDGRGLGIHLTPSIEGNILLGPSAEPISRIENTANTAKILAKLKLEAFKLLPELSEIDIIKSYAGIRPKLFKPGGPVNEGDFFLKEIPAKMFNLIGIESPGLTSSPALAKYVTDTFVAKYFKLEKKKNFISKRSGLKTTRNLHPKKLHDLWKENNNFGEVVCRCEQVTRGEIIEALNNPLGVQTLNGIKKRTRATMGRCQSGFCLPRICELMEKEFGFAPNKIRKNSKNSNLLTGFKE